MFVVWRSLRSVAAKDFPGFGALAKGFGFLFLSVALPFSIGVVAIVLGDSADEISELWFTVPAAVLTLVGTVYIAIGARQFSGQAIKK